ncbi:CD99 molecule isoform X2 [Pimephales promelas]|uniref:CD99 molecule isoform X2 n=1 Tax=Pimephales promelas TaxID=90988 RepID=UPI00195595D1|nr:CD99 molecule isoform X2 [Pimephales promelas]
MTSYTWILLIFASLAATRAQDLDLSHAFDDDDSPAKPTVKPAVKPDPPKNPDQGFDLLDAFDSDPKKPAVVPPKSGDDKKNPSGDEFDLSDAFNPDLDPKKPVVPPKERGTGGGTFDDKDLFGVSDGGEYTPDKGRIGGGGADPGYDDQSGGPSDQPQDLNQQWLQLIKMLGDNIPEGLSVWIAGFLQVVEPLLEQFRGLLNVTEEKAEL